MEILQPFKNFLPSLFLIAASRENVKLKEEEKMWQTVGSPETTSTSRRLRVTFADPLKQEMGETGTRERK